MEYGGVGEASSSTDDVSWHHVGPRLNVRLTTLGVQFIFHDSEPTYRAVLVDS